MKRNTFGRRQTMAMLGGAAALAWALFGESFTLLQSIGIVLVAVGLIIARFADTTDHGDGVLVRATVSIGLAQHGADGAADCRL